jgi:hypothetical protein
MALMKTGMYSSFGHLFGSLIQITPPVHLYTMRSIPGFP